MQRWVVAAQCIVTHLPAHEQEAAAHDCQQRFRQFMWDVSKLYTLAASTTDERDRWESGFGAVDMAIIEAVGMVDYLHDMAKRIAVSEETTGLLRTIGNARDTAMRALRDLAVERLETLNLTTWRTDKPEMFAFAQADGGGMGPDEAAYFYTRGSKFIAC